MTDRIAFAGPVSLEGRRIRGSVTLAGERTWRGGEWLEVDPAALVRADASDVIGRWEHDPSKVLGRSSNGTVRVNRTETGIDYEIDVPDTSYGNDLITLMNRGDIRGSSFEIEGLRHSFSTDPDGTRVRRITSIKRLTDVSPVTDPAFVNTNAATFSKETSDMEETIVEPTAQAPVIIPEAPSDTYATAEAFARKQDLSGLEQAMENLIAGGLETAARQETYAAFAKVYDNRRGADADAKERSERLALAHQLRTGKGPKAPKATRETVESEDYLHAFDRYMRTGDKVLMEQFAQSIAGTGAEGGYTVPDGFLKRISERQLAYGGVRKVGEIITTGDGQSLRWPSNDDTSNSAAVVAEGVAGTAGADLVFGTVTLGAFSYSSNGTGNVPLKVSRELLQDSAFDVEAFVGRKLGERIGRKQAVDLAVGAGTTLPFGLLSKTPDTMTATKTRAAAVEMEFQVDAAYREQGNCGWIMSDTVLALYRNAVDLSGRPLWLANADAGMTTRPGGILNGYPVTIDNAAGTLVAFGDFRQGYIIRDVKSVEVLVDPYTYSSTRQIGYHAWARMDANIQDAFAYSVSQFSGVSADATA
jgi:HK97 family phage major capsid protein/HK97 family phage prohead protease